MLNLVGQSNYLKYRGKCKEMSEELIQADPSLRLVRGYYHDAGWGKQPHWWCIDTKGNIIDPTKLQFPSEGRGIYEEFDGKVNCSECDKEMLEHEADLQGRYAFCKDQPCYMYFTGVEEYLSQEKRLKYKEYRKQLLAEQEKEQPQ